MVSNTCYINLDLDNDKIITHESCSTTVIRFQVSDLIRSSLITSFLCHDTKRHLTQCVANIMSCQIRSQLSTKVIGYNHKKLVSSLGLVKTPYSFQLHQDGQR